MVALDAPLATLATLDPRRLLGFPVKLLDLPTQAARLLPFVHRIPRKKVVRDDPLRAARMHHYPEQRHLVLFGEALDLYELALPQFLFAPVEPIHPLVRLLTP